MNQVEEQRLPGIAQLLVDEKLLTKEQVIQYWQKANEHSQTLLQYIAHNKILPSDTLGFTIAANFGAPLFDLDSVDIDSIPSSLVNDKLVRKHCMIPLYQRSNYLYIATDDPSKQVPLKEIQFHTGMTCFAIVVETEKLHRFIDKLINEKESNSIKEYVDEGHDLEGLEVSAEDDDAESETLSVSSEDAPVVKFVNKIIVDAIRKSVSDIHFEPYEKEYRIRYRRDGILYEVASPPISLTARITARIKIMSNLDISERRVPQDGRFKMRISRTRAVDFRVSTCPTIAGEKIVMRLLDPDITKLGIEKLGFNEAQKKAFLTGIDKPQGMILVTGPTGSGKTVTLYTALNILNTVDINISTAEDPVEIKIVGINQVHINPKTGLTFSGALRSFLRQDPDVIMVGEIRDLETAEISVKAAQTGHLVLSTLHTNSAAETLVRLLNMGIPTFNLASSVSLIIAQRLVRMLCDHCKVLRDDFTLESLIELGFPAENIANIKLYKAVGCNQCSQGFRGRLGLFEVMPLTKRLGQVIMSGGSSIDILNAAKEEGMITIYQSGLEKISAGLTTIEEVNRVTVE